MFKKIILGLAIIFIGFLIYIGIKPSEYTITREISIKAPADIIFPYINDSRKMDSWNPWMDLDPKAKVSFTGPDSGIGATTAWEGGEKLGTGRATVIESLPNSLVKTKLEYVQPRAMTQVAEISLKANGAETVVRWSVSGQNVFFGRLVCFFINMDKMIGGTFEKGLMNLKNKIEGAVNTQVG